MSQNKMGMGGGIFDYSPLHGPTICATWLDGAAVRVEERLVNQGFLPECGRAWVGSPGTGGRTRQRFGVCTELTPSTLRKGQSAGSAGPTEGLIERGGP